MTTHKLLGFTTAALVTLFSGLSSARADLLELSHNPLFLQQNVPSAIALTFDDSGSMAWGDLSAREITGERLYAYASYDANKGYYNPDLEYVPPFRADGTQFPNANPSSAWVDGFNTWFGKVDLYNHYVPVQELVKTNNGRVGIRFERVPGIQAIENVRDGNLYYDEYPTSRQIRSNGTEAFYYRWKGDADASFDDMVDTNDGDYWEYVGSNQIDMQNFANWYSYYNVRHKLAKSAISRAFTSLDKNFKMTWQALNTQTHFNVPDIFDGVWRNQFFEWMFQNPTSGFTPLRSAYKRAGELFQRDTTYKSTDFGDNLSCQQNFHISISDGLWNGSAANVQTDDEDTGITLPGDSEGRYGTYTGTGESRIYPAPNNGDTLSDVAFHYWANDLMPNLDNAVRPFKADYTDANGNIIEFEPGQDEWENEAFIWNPKNDPAYWQHMVTYNIGLGIRPEMVLECREYLTEAQCELDQRSIQNLLYKGLRDGSITWPDAVASERGRVDDLWHSSVNSRGDFISANSPGDLIEALESIVNKVLERVARGSTSAVSSGVITASTLAVTPSFDTSTWTGYLQARSVNSDGTFGNTLWDSACILTGGYCKATGSNEIKQLDRRIFVFDEIANTISPLGPGMSTYLRSLLSVNASQLLQNLNRNETELLAFLRGDQSRELQNDGSFRNRVNLLGDIIHSRPLIVRGPSEIYDDNLWPDGSPEQDNPYEEFKLAKKDRANLVLVGANDGMLHAFDMQSGEEKWALIPSKAFEHIHKLANPAYDHRTFVDGSPMLKDVLINDQWRSLVVTGLRYGGQAYVALDVTNTDALQPRVLWEFTDADDADLGYTYGEPTVVRLSSTGQWVALLPNGYNNSELDGFTSGSGHAVMFVVDVATGQMIAKLDTGVGTTHTPNGLAPIIGVDSSKIRNSAGEELGTDQGTDYAYAGDLYGNLWRFDLTGDPGDWQNGITRVVKADNIMERPITQKPRVIGYPFPDQSLSKDAVVMFGTGKYLEIPDRSIHDAKTQYVVAVVDGIENTDVPIDYLGSGIVEQSISNTQGTLRELSNNPGINPDTGVRGWRIKLPQQGERMTNPMTRIGNGLLLFSTIIPGGDNPCLAGGTSWLMAVNPLSGGVPDEGSIFEDEFTVVDNQGNPVTTVAQGDGLFINDLIVGSPPVLENYGGGTTHVIVEGADGELDIQLKTFTWRRRNWSNLGSQ